MSNKETIQEYSERLEENNTSLDDILTTINNLPEAGSGVGNRNIITVGLSSDTEFKSFSSSVVPLNAVLNQKGDKLSLDTTNNAVKIGAGVSKILVSGTITQMPTALGLYGGNISKNGFGLAMAVNIGFNYIPAINVFYKTTFPPVLVDVVEGDLIYLTTYSETDKSVTIKAYNGRSTNITVEVVE